MRARILSLVAVCVLSAVVASAVTLLLAKSGPTGPPGRMGERGARGREGPEGYVDTDALNLGGLESEVADLGSEVEWLELEQESLSTLERDMRNLESEFSELCFALNAC